MPKLYQFKMPLTDDCMDADRYALDDYRLEIGDDLGFEGEGGKSLWK